MRSTLKLTAFAALTALALSTTGCNGGEVGRQEQPTPAPAPAPDPGAPTTGPDGNPLPGPTPPAPVANYSGVYEVVAPLDFTQNGVLPGIVSPLLGDSPSFTIILATRSTPSSRIRASRTSRTS